VRDLLPPTLSQHGGEAEGSLLREVPGAGGSSPEKAGERQHCQMVRVWRAYGEEYGQEPASTSLKGLLATNLADMGSDPTVAKSDLPAPQGHSALRPAGTPSRRSIRAWRALPVEVLHDGLYPTVPVVIGEQPEALIDVRSVRHH